MAGPRPHPRRRRRQCAAHPAHRDGAGARARGPRRRLAAAGPRPAARGGGRRPGPRPRDSARGAGRRRRPAGAVVGRCSADLADHGAGGWSAVRRRAGRAACGAGRARAGVGRRARGARAGRSPAGLGGVPGVDRHRRAAHLPRPGGRGRRRPRDRSDGRR